MSKSAKILLVISSLFTLAIGLSNIFVNIFLWKSSNDLIVVAGYNLTHYIFVPAAFIAAGWISKKRNGVWPIRMGVVFFVLFFILILLLKDRTVTYAYLLGILFGIAAGFYWLAFHVLSFEFTSIDNRDTFNGIDGAVVGLCNAAAPLTASYIINRYPAGYTIVFALSLGLFVILTLVTLLLRAEHCKRKFELKKVFGSNSEDWSRLRKSIGAWGMRDVVIIFLISVLAFKTTGSEWQVGKLSLYTYLISSIAFLLVQRFVKPKRRKLSVYLGAFFMFAAVWGLILGMGLPALLFYVIIDAAFMPFFIVPISSASFNIINRSHEEDIRVEYIINREIALNIGRAVSTLILIGLLIFTKSHRIPNYYILFIGSAQLISIYFLKEFKAWEG